MWKVVTTSCDTGNLKITILFLAPILWKVEPFHGFDKQIFYSIFPHKNTEIVIAEYC